MKRLLVVSDSHGERRALQRIAEETWKVYGPVDAYLHCGDGAGDFQDVMAGLREHDPQAQFFQVRGNCDWASAAPALLRTEVEGQKVFATHGHLYDVKMGRDYQRLRYAALEADARLVLFGHTHIPYHDRVWGMELVNPGSIGYGARPSYAVVTIDGKTIAADLKRA